MRAEMYMRVLAHRGMPPRGSFQDRVAQEMILRERRRYVTTQIYQARLIAGSYSLPQPLFDAWTMLFIDEVSHDNYQPKVVKQKRRILDGFDKKKKTEQARVDRVETYTVKTSRDLTPYTAAELEVVRSKLRRRAIAQAQQQHLPPDPPPSTKKVSR